MEKENVYYSKKNVRGPIIGTLLVLVVILLFYFFNIFNINPMKTIQLINGGTLKAEHSRDYIFSIEPINEDEFQDLQIIINEDTNTDMSEALQHISLSSGDNLFDWDRFFKFDTGLIKTPYDTRYIKFENLSGSNEYNYSNVKSYLTNLFISSLSKNSNFLFDKNNYEVKKLKINAAGADFNEKVKLYYTINLTDEASDIFSELCNQIWNSDEFLSFFKIDDEIQKKLGMDNNTKSIIDIVYNIKKNAKVKDLEIGIIANKNFVESITYDFTLSLNDGTKNRDLKLSFGEYVKELDDGYSPEAIFEPMSTVNITALSETEHRNIDDEVLIDDTFGVASSSEIENTENDE